MIPVSYCLDDLPDELNWWKNLSLEPTEEQKEQQRQNQIQWERRRMDDELRDAAFGKDYDEQWVSEHIAVYPEKIIYVLTESLGDDEFAILGSGQDIDLLKEEAAKYIITTKFNNRYIQGTTAEWIEKNVPKKDDWWRDEESYPFRRRKTWRWGDYEIALVRVLNLPLEGKP